MNYFSKTPDISHQAQQYALPRRHNVTNQRNNSQENNNFKNGTTIRNENREAPKKEQVSTNTIRNKPKAAKPLIFTPPKVNDQQIKYEQINDYVESMDHLFNEKISSELETKFPTQLSDQPGKGKLKTEELKLFSYDKLKENQVETLLVESSSFIENESSLNEDLVKTFTALLEESSSYIDESSSRFDESSSHEDSSSSYDESSSREESTSSVAESSSHEESTSSVDESSSHEESTSSYVESSSHEESTSSYDESSSQEESSSPVDESSSHEESTSSYVESSSHEESTSSYVESSSHEESTSSYDESSSHEESSSPVDESSSDKESSSSVSYLDKFKEHVQYPIVKLPVLLAMLQVDIDIYDLFTLEVPISNVTKIDWSIHSLDCNVLLPTSNVFLKGELIADIEYVKENAVNSLHSVKIIIPLDKVIQATWLHCPKIPCTDQAEYMFQLNDHNDIQYHREFIQKFAEPIYSELLGVNTIWHNELISKESKQELGIQGTINLSINLLQSQYLDLNRFFDK